LVALLRLRAPFTRTPGPFLRFSYTRCVRLRAPRLVAHTLTLRCVLPLPPYYRCSRTRLDSAWITVHPTGSLILRSFRLLRVRIPACLRYLRSFLRALFDFYAAFAWCHYARSHSCSRRYAGFTRCCHGLVCRATLCVSYVLPLCHIVLVCAVADVPFCGCKQPGLTRAPRYTVPLNVTFYLLRAAYVARSCVPAWMLRYLDWVLHYARFAFWFRSFCARLVTAGFLPRITCVRLHTFGCILDAFGLLPLVGLDDLTVIQASYCAACVVRCAPRCAAAPQPAVLCCILLRLRCVYALRCRLLRRTAYDFPRSAVIPRLPDYAFLPAVLDYVVRGCRSAFYRVCCGSRLSPSSRSD